MAIKNVFVFVFFCGINYFLYKIFRVVGMNSTVFYANGFS